MAKTKISWADYSWNPISGCSKVSDSCANCYAEAMTRRFDKGWKPWTKENAVHNVRLHPERLEQPLHWRKPRRIFVCSMGDLFHERVPYDYIDQVFGVMGAAKRHTFQVLTKRPHKMCDYLASYATRERTREIAKSMGMKVETGPFWIKADLWEWPLPNVWLGVTAENQRAADERIPLLLQTPAAVRFVSIEPMLAPVVLDDFAPFSWPDIDPNTATQIREMWGPKLPENSVNAKIPEIRQIIVGGESGPKARPMNPEWPRLIRDQCQATGTPFFFKQWGEWRPWQNGDAFERMALFNRDQNGDAPVYFRDLDLHRRENWSEYEHGDELVTLVGKKAAGRELDGRIWDEAP